MKGVYTALITPFDRSGRIDLAAFKRIVADQKDARVAGIVPCGTTGESPTLSFDEKKLLIETCVQELKGSGVKVVAGTGTNDTAETIETSRWASEAGVDGVLVVTPYYNKPSQTGLESHFLKVADSVNCEVILYNVPGRTGVSLTAPTITRLAAHPRIRSIKEATGNVEFTSEILDSLSVSGASMDILSGDDATFLPALSVGAAGVISVASNLFPRAMVAIQQAFESGRAGESLALHRRYFPLFRDLFIESNPGPIKVAMSAAGWCEPHLRAPLAPLSATSAETLMKSLARCEIQKGRKL